MFLVLFLIVFGICLIYLWLRRKLYYLSFMTPGPLALPFVGNLYLFMGRSFKEYHLIMVDIINIYGDVLRFWFGPKLIILFRNPKHVSKILSSSKVVDKHPIYQFLEPVIGLGLISGSGKTWKLPRKLTQPLYDTKFVEGVVALCPNHINICIKKLEKHVNGDSFDVEKLIKLCVIDIIGESIFGLNLQTQLDKNQDFVQSCVEIYELVVSRMFKFWLHPNITYYFSKNKQKVDKCCKIIQKIINEAIDHAETSIIQRKSKPFRSSVEEILIKNADLDCLNRETTQNMLTTLFFASEDTISITISAACLCFGMYPTYQKLAFEEIQTILGDKEHYTLDDIQKLTYLDRCIKDVLRLFPIAAWIGRECQEDFTIDNMVLPEGCGIFIAIFNLHLNPDYWERSKEFFPDHFLPENVQNRHPFCYIPFSGGPRGCIGKLFAQNIVKLIMVHILKNFSIEADGKYLDVYKEFVADISVRPCNGYNIRIKKRWNKNN